MKEIKNLLEQQQNKLLNGQGEAQSVLETPASNIEFEREFCRLWGTLDMYYPTTFNAENGEVDGPIAELWRNEFHIRNFTGDNIEVIYNNLDLLDNPQFVPKIPTLLQLHTKVINIKFTGAKLGPQADMKELEDRSKRFSDPNRDFSVGEEHIDKIRIMLGMGPKYSKKSIESDK
jgi:hypothetical protein